MANKKTDMSKLRQMLRLYAQGESKLKISELTGVSRNTLKKYLKIYQRLGLTPQDIDGVERSGTGPTVWREPAAGTRRQIQNS